MAALSSASLGTPTLSTPFPKPAEYSTTDLVLTFFKEKLKDLAKAGAYMAFWATEANPHLSSGVKEFNFMMKDFKNFIGITEIPEKLHTLSGSVSILVSDLSGTWDKVWSASRKVFKDTMALISSGVDSIEFANRFIPLSKDVLRGVSTMNFAALLASCGTGALEQVQNINGMREIDSKRTTFYLINLARDVSYLALAVIGLSFMLTATPVVPWMMIACSTAGLACSIGSYFYERIHDPENKGKNLNPSIVVENYVNQRKACPPHSS
jgi:hypothetical protein